MTDIQKRSYMPHPKQPEQFCPHGHDTIVVGRDKKGKCKDCVKDYTAKYELKLKNGERVRIPKVQFCPKGHDTFVTGRLPDSTCIQCKEEYDMRYYEVNKKIILEKTKQYQTDNQEKVKEYHRNWYLEHRDELLAYQEEYIQGHREERNKHQVERIATDINFKLRTNLRSRIIMAIKGNAKRGSAVRDLGCSIEFLKDHIASKFHSGMAWDNWGEVWELDHITPLFKFNLTDREQFLQAVNYKNLQPLTVEDHRKKTNLELSEWNFLTKK